LLKTGYIKKAALSVGGQVGLMSVKDTPAAIMKIVVHDIDPRTMNFRPSPPASAHLIAPDFSTNASSFVQGTQSDTPGALFLVFQALPTFKMIAEGLERNRISIGIMRNSGGSAILVDVDTSVEDTIETKKIRSGRTALDFFNCTKVLIRP
jgi:hypothetical protein